MWSRSLSVLILKGGKRAFKHFTIVNPNVFCRKEGLSWRRRTILPSKVSRILQGHNNPDINWLMNNKEGSCKF